MSPVSMFSPLPCWYVEQLLLRWVPSESGLIPLGYVLPWTSTTGALGDRGAALLIPAVANEPLPAAASITSPLAGALLSAQAANEVRMHVEPLRSLPSTVPLARVTAATAAD